MRIYADSIPPPVLVEVPAVPLKGLVDDLFIFLTDLIIILIIN